MPRLEDRYERLEETESEAVVARLNSGGDHGVQVIQVDSSDGRVEVWLSRELPLTAAGLR